MHQRVAGLHELKLYKIAQEYGVFYTVCNKICKIVSLVFPRIIFLRCCKQDAALLLLPIFKKFPQKMELSSKIEIFLDQYTTTPYIWFFSCLLKLKGQTPFVPPSTRRAKSWSNIYLINTPPHGFGGEVKNGPLGGGNASP